MSGAGDAIASTGPKCETVRVDGMYHWRGEFRDCGSCADATFENAAVGIAHIGMDGSWLRVNEKLLDIVGYDRNELARITFQDITHPDDLDADLEQFEALKAGRITSYQMEKRYFRKNGDLVWINLTVGLQRDAEGNPDFCISVVEDIGARKADEAHLNVLVNELNHRVKNTLATVQAIAHMSFRKDEPIEQARADFTRRLNALAGAHDLLTDEKWSGADIGSVVARALRPFTLAEEGRFRTSGPRIRLPARSALTLAMAINELATNAVKYGALSNDEGEVTICWDHDVPDGGLTFEWIESGGPAVSAPAREGFGSTLLMRILPGDLNGEARIEHAESGVRFSLKAARPSPADS